MITTSYYFKIRPREALIKKVNDYSAAYDFDISRIFLDEELWTKRGTYPMMIDEGNLIKAMHLADLYSEYVATDFVRNNNPQLYAFFIEILGSEHYSLQTFDTWWELEYVGKGVNVYEGYEAGISLEALRHFSETGDAAVDKWVTRSIKTRSSG